MIASSEAPSRDTVRKALVIGLGVFLVTLLFQTVTWRVFGMVDSSMWGHQVGYVLDHDPAEFNYLLAYGHPGGTIIEGSVFIHTLTGASYETAVLIFVSICCSAFLAVLCALTVLFEKERLWWLGTMLLLSFSWFYTDATPPSAIASVGVPLLGLYSLYIYERNAVPPARLLWWSALSGFLVATRADIGGCVSAAFVLFLVPRIGWKNVALITGGAMVFFTALDPFMWFMPVQHVGDLVFKMVYHYADYTPTHLTIANVIGFSALPFVGVALAGYFFFTRRNTSTPVPPSYLVVLAGLTVVLYVVFLSARSQAVRYFIPLVFLWELFLPLLVLRLIDRIPVSRNTPPEARARRVRYARGVVLLLFFLYNAIPFLLSITIMRAYNLL